MKAAQENGSRREIAPVSFPSRSGSTGVVPAPRHGCLPMPKKGISKDAKTATESSTQLTFGSMIVTAIREKKP